MQHGPRDQRFKAMAEALGYGFDGEIKIGGNYSALPKGAAVELDLIASALAAADASKGA